MKNLFITIFFSIALLSCKIAFAQNADRNFGKIFETYYLHKDSAVVNKAIDFINKTQMDYSRLSPIITGFFGAAFLNNEAIKKDFSLKINLIEKPEIKQLLISLLKSNIDTVYSEVKKSASLNDMYWSSFFATGNTKYLDNIISHLPYMENRVDVNLFLTGASAKWSLCGNSRKSDVINKYLNSLKDKNPSLKEILDNDPQYFNNEIISILKKQRELGIWN